MIFRRRRSEPDPARSGAPLPGARDFPAGGVDGVYRVACRYKELVDYVEGDRVFTFDAGWGVSPPVLYVPDPSIWDDVVPDWLVGRYDEVHARLVAHSGHVVRTTTTGYPPRSG